MLVSRRVPELGGTNFCQIVQLIIQIKERSWKGILFQPNASCWNQNWDTNSDTHVPMNKQGWYISFKRKDYSSFRDDGSSLRSSIRFHPFSWRIHHGMIPFFTWTTKTHSPSNSNWWGGELHQVLRSYWSGPTKAMITLDCWWCWWRIQSPNDVLCCFFLKA